jgi:hypothetical protein
VNYTSHTAGKISLYSWANGGTRFDDVVVTAAGGGRVYVCDQPDERLGGRSRRFGQRERYGRRAVQLDGGEQRRVDHGDLGGERDGQRDGGLFGGSQWRVGRAPGDGDHCRADIYRDAGGNFGRRRAVSEHGAVVADEELDHRRRGDLLL